MKEITIVSGKGGTGKTSIAAALASLAQNTVFCDNDVDAADLHLLFQPHVNETHPFSSGYKATINNQRCNACNICLEHCRFNAIHLNGSISINPLQCEGCRLCERLCPTGAITSKQSKNNQWFVSDTRFGTLVHARMAAGEENSGHLVTLIRKKAKQIATQTRADYILNDGPPGIGCTAISALTGTHRVLLVIEPTKSGWHDIKRIIELIESFNIETFALINKYDINEIMSLKIEAYLQSLNIPLLAKIPFDKKMVEAMIEGKTIVEHSPTSKISIKMHMVWAALKN